MITEITRRNIIDDIILSGVSYCGNLGEIDFLKRLIDLDSMPSTDRRYKNMHDDILQHRMNNYDWDDNWVYYDDRINLIRGSNENFLKFLCEMIHPVVRKEQDVIQNLLDIFNNHLSNDNFEIRVKNFISKKPIFNWIKIDETPILVENLDKVNSQFIKDGLDKCDNKLKNNDYDGAITNARSLLEDAIIRDIHKQITGSEMKTKGDLVNDYKEIKKMLNLAEKDTLDDSFKQVTSGLSSIVNGISSISNKMGDRHSREVIPEKHHAKLVVNSSKILVDFLYDVLDYQKNRVESFKVAMYSLPYTRYGEGNCFYGKCYSLKQRDDLIEEERYNLLFKRCDKFIKRILLDDLLSNFQINCYDDADKFFIIVTLFFDVINKDDILEIFKKTKDNNQSSFKLVNFLTDLNDIKPDFMNKNIKDFLNLSSLNS